MSNFLTTLFLALMVTLSITSSYACGSKTEPLKKECCAAKKEKGQKSCCEPSSNHNPFSEDHDCDGNCGGNNCGCTHSIQLFSKSNNVFTSNVELVNSLIVSEVNHYYQSMFITAIPRSMWLPPKLSASYSG